MPTAAAELKTHITPCTTDTYLHKQDYSYLFHFYITVDIAGANYNVVVWPTIKE